MSFPLLQLPVELVISVFDELDVQQLLRCVSVSAVNLRVRSSSPTYRLQTCQALYRVVRGCATLQYRIELAAAGRVNGPLGGPAPGERLWALRLTEQAWQNIVWREKELIPTGCDNAMWDVCSGHLAWAYLEEPSPAKAAAGLRDTLAVLDLNSDEQESPSWTLEFDRPFLSFAMDPGQDLLVVVEKEVNPLIDKCCSMMLT